MAEIQVNAKMLRHLADASRRAGTQDKFIDMALEWADKAEAHVESLQLRIEQLEAERNALKDKLQFVCRQLDDIAIEGTIPTAVFNIAQDANPPEQE